jgi:hypothetical protein
MRTSRMSVVLSLLALASCDRDVAPTTIQGVPATLEEMAPSQVAGLRDTLVAQFMNDAGLNQNELAVGSENWALVFRAGVYEVSRQCDIYLNELFRFQRRQRAGQQGLAAIAGTTGAVLGLTNAAASVIALTSTAFGLTSNLFDISTNSLIYAMEPSALRNVVLQGRQAYLRSVDQTKIRSRPDMLIYLQGYLAQCSPAAIEAGVNNAAAGSPNAVTIGTDEQRQAAAQLAAPMLSLLQRAERVAGPTGRVTPIQQQQRPPNGMLEGDRPNITPSQVRAIQTALGLPEANRTGGINRETRIAIQEFQRGMVQRRGVARWNETDGRLRGNTLRALLGLGDKASETEFRGPFERALFGLAPDYTSLDREMLFRLRGTLAELGISDETARAVGLTDGISVLHASVVERRKRPDAEPAVGNQTALDSALYALISDQPTQQSSRTNPSVTTNALEPNASGVTRSQ